MQFIMDYRGYGIYFSGSYYLVMEGWDYHQIPFAEVEDAKQFCDERGDAKEE